MSANYAYVVNTARRLSPNGSPRLLDFGCGGGEVVALACELGMDAQGVDTFSEYPLSWQEHVPSAVKDRIHKIEGPLPFADAYFDVVVSNQVFEHIPNPPEVLPEINRVLKPGGIFLALFPVRETWYEGHVGLYFAHRMSPNVQKAYLTLAHRVGLGFHRSRQTSQDWAATQSSFLRQGCFYHRTSDVLAWWREAFGHEPVSLAGDFLAFRLGRMSGVVPETIRRHLFGAITHIRAGVVLLTRKASNLP